MAFRLREDIPLPLQHLSPHALAELHARTAAKLNTVLSEAYCEARLDVREAFLSNADTDVEPTFGILER